MPHSSSLPSPPLSLHHKFKIGFESASSSCANDSGSKSYNLTLQILFRMEILQSEVGLGIEDSSKQNKDHKKQIAAQIEALYQYGKFQFECGNYSGIIDLFNQDKYLNAIQTSAPHLLRYLATTFIVNKRRRPQFKDFIKVIQLEQNSYKDPITEFMACVYVNYEFDGAQKKMRECEEVILNDPFLEQDPNSLKRKRKNTKGKGKAKNESKQGTQETQAPKAPAADAPQESQNQAPPAAIPTQAPESTQASQVSMVVEPSQDLFADISDDIIASLLDVEPAEPAELVEPADQKRKKVKDLYHDP
ncbi:hypothetical protein P8452_51610 [Trifolium repens]|nr:hypothetical protein P8452_51610 [Trifolium repens]